MGKHIITCRYCKAKFDISELTLDVDYVNPIPRFYYHKDCYDKYCQSDDQYLAKIYNYLKNEIGMKVDYAAMKRQCETFQNKYKYTLKGIYYSLKYHYGVKKGSVEKSQNRIGIVPYVYEEAKTYYENLESKKRFINKNIDKQKNNVEAVRVVQKKDIARERVHIDLDKLIEEELRKEELSGR